MTVAAEPASVVWAVAQQRDGRLEKASLEAATAARALAERLRARVVAVVLGHEIESVATELATAGVDGVLQLDHPGLATYTPESYVAALAMGVKERKPAAAILPHTYQSVDFVARLAQHLDWPLVPEITGFEDSDGTLLWRRPILGGKLNALVEVEGEGPFLATVQSGAYPSSGVDAATAPVDKVDLSSLELPTGREIVEVVEAAEETVDLSQASVIVAVGRGVGGEENLDSVRELADLLGAEIGASRPVIDSGWLPRDRQIGSSGQTVSPKLYLSLGISGAIQHLVGMKGSQTVVAVNKDANAPIFAVADLGIVGDLHEVVPALIERLRERA